MNESESPKKKKLRAVDHSLNAKIEIKDQLSLDLHFRVLYNIDGVFLNEDTCPKIELLDTFTDQEKSSQFWLSYTNHFGNIVESEKKVWIHHFAVDNGIGKTDFGLKLRLVEKPTLAFREWLR